jgi:hypothetical protein
VTLTWACSASSAMAATNAELIALTCGISGYAALSAATLEVFPITAAIACFMVLAAAVGLPPQQGIAFAYAFASIASGSLAGASASGDLLASAAPGTITGTVT